MAIITHHTYPDLLHSGDRLATTEWDCGGTPQEAVDATIAIDDQSVILTVTDWRGWQAKRHRGFAPGGIG